MEKRMKYVDIVRAIAMILIVVGHTLVHSHHCNIVFKFIYSFHVALFFIISGFLHKEETTTFKNYFIKRFKRLMIPYFIWSTLFLIPYLLFGKNIADSLNVTSSFGIIDQLRNVIYGIGKDNLLKQNSSLWFLPALFSMNIFFYFFINKDDNKNKVILKTVFMFFIGIFSSISLKINLPWGINTVLNVGIFYYIGYILKKYEILLKKEKKNKYVILLLIIIGMLSFHFNTTVMYIDYIYGNYFLMFISSLSFSLIIIKTAILINNNFLLEYIGKNTIGILIFHKILVVIFQTKLGVISKLLLNSNLVIEILLTIVVTILSIIISLTIYNFLIKVIPFSFGIKKEKSNKKKFKEVTKKIFKRNSMN